MKVKIFEDMDISEDLEKLEKNAWENYLAMEKHYEETGYYTPEEKREAEYFNRTIIINPTDEDEE